MNRNQYVGEQIKPIANEFRRLPIHDEIEQLSTKETTDAAWAVFTRNTLKIEGWMVSAVQEVIRQGRWKSVQNPVGYIKTASIREANRMGLKRDDYKAAIDRSRRCACGFATTAQALKMGHECIAGEVGCIADIKIPAASWSQDGGDTVFKGSRGNDSYTTSSGRRRAMAAHDNAMDLLLHANGAEDGYYEPLKIEDEHGRTFFGPPILSKVKNEYIKLCCQNDDPLDGEARVNWTKVGRDAGLNEFEAMVLELRNAYGYSRENIFDSVRIVGVPHDESLRRKFQAAWKAIDRRREKIASTLRIPTDQNKSWLGPRRQIAPPTKRAMLPMPERLRKDDSDVLKALDRRFETRPTELTWGQNLRSGRRY